ncbi:MAG: glycoside hydrolase family 99-like domain-containing protein [Glaciimonas sp.]|nr:glycoside hydrolase family 99-like domain-containing protein [Glaciimonas sp.]
MFNEQIYLLANPDVEEALNRGEFTSGMEHFQKYGHTEGRITNAHQFLSDQARHLSLLKQAVAEHDGQIAHLNQAVTVRDVHISNLNHAVAEGDVQIANFNQMVNEIRNSTSWRLTSPVRSIGTLLKRLRHIMKLVSSAIKQGGGIKLAVGKAVRIYQNEGMAGVRSALSVQRIAMPTRPIDSLQPLREVVDSKPVKSRSNFIQARTEFVEYQKNPPINPLVKLIAFYLPQFHPFTENDEWWGKGFTEWTNVGKSLPNYVGHYQPHCPIHSGYYDLRVPEVMEGQAKLAKEFGIYGFSYYFYWFGGKILMDTPLELMLTNKKVDIPFCLTWANENWSRRWDGQENDILIAQNHSDEDSLAFIRHLVKYFKDERYIRIDGKPVLIIYRANIIPNIAATAKIWREEVIRNGLPGLYLVSAQTFGIYSPKEFDFDASVEFPPHNVRGTDVSHEVELVNPEFNGQIFSYDQWVANAVLKEEPDYKLYRTAMLSWDNTARKQNNSHIFHGFSLQRYKQWLSSIVNKVYSNQKYTTDEKIVFINAWNEWAEGTHLEPDQKVGYGYLQTTYDVLRHSNDLSPKIIVVTHDAFPSGAQYHALNIARELKQGFGFKVEIVCLGDGVLKNKYAQYARLQDLDGLDHRGPEAHALVRNLVADGHKFAIVNTTVSGFFLETLKAHGIMCISLIHELRGVIDQYNMYEQAKTIASLADRVVFPAQQVSDQFQEVAPVRDAHRVLRPQGLYKKNARVHKRDAARQELRSALKLPPDALIVLGVGYADYRKGIDLFVEAGNVLVGRLPNVYLVWLGHWEAEIQKRVEQSLAKDPQMSSHFIFPGRREDTDMFYAGADVYALTSREDPFPSVMLEAMDASLPVVGFEGIGGCTELFALGCGKLVPAFDVNAFASVLEEILEDHDLANRMGQTGQTQIHERFSFRNYLFDLLKLLKYPLQRVSVVVPNYNYARFLVDRIRTIEKQIFPIYELIILDDCSTDDSAQVIKEIIQNSALDIKFVRNDTNSGSVFAQWQKGVELATGDLVWIAEADDLSEPNFLSDVLRGFDNPDVVLSYCESKQISFDGKVLCDNYLDYVADISRERWLRSYVSDGPNQIADALSVKNTIPNVSAVVFRREILSEVLKREQVQVREFTVAGDWYIYTKLLEHGGLSFTPNSSNLHRRHDQSVTISSLNLSQLAEIVRMQRIVATSHLVSDSMKETARCYAQELYEQFGLSSREFPNFERVIETVDSA